MPKRSGSSSSRGSNKRRTQRRVPTTQTDLGPWIDLRNIMNSVVAYSARWNPSQENLFLRLCIQDPSLVTNIFCVGYDSRRVTPLAFLIQYRAKLSLVQAFCNQFPRAVEIKTVGLYPVEIACAKADVVPGIVPFLAGLYPMAACNTKLATRTTLDHLLDNFNDNINNASNLETIKAVVGAANTKFGFLDEEEDQSRFFHQVITAGDCYKQRNLMNFVVQRCCPEVTEVKISAKHLGDMYYVPADISSRVGVLAPRLKDVDIDIDLDLEDLEAWENFMHALGNSAHLHSLKLRIIDWPEDEVKRELFADALFDALGNISNLKRLFLRGCGDIRLSGKGGDGDDEGGALGEILTSILKRNSIETMMILESEPEPKHEPILAALKDNTSLNRFGILSCYDTEEKKKAILGLLTEKNTSLEHVIDFDDSTNSVMDQITLLCHLNQFGRGMARDPFTPPAALVALVEEAVEVDEMYAELYAAENPEDMPYKSTGLDLIYGLLRECPSIWCG